MGCGGSKEFEVELATCATPFTAEQCAMGKAPSADVLNFQLSVSMMKQEGIYSDLATRATILSGKMISTFNKESETLDPEGKRIAVCKAKTLTMIPQKMETRLLLLTPSFDGQASDDFASDDKDKATPLYNFAKITATQKMGAEGEYALYTSAGETKVMLTGKRLAGMKQKYLIYDAAGALVAKAKTTDTMGKNITFEIAGGIDVAAVFTLVSALGPGGGGGANAGSGTGAYG